MNRHLILICILALTVAILALAQMEICTVPSFKGLSIIGTTAQTTWMDAGFTGGFTIHDYISGSAILSQSLEAGSRQLCWSSITVHDHNVDQ